MTGNIYKGKVLTIDGNIAKVAPADDIDLVSRSVKVSERVENLKKDDDVIFCIFPDNTGMIIEKF